MKKEKRYTEAELVAFGNYLLSKQRTETIEVKENLDKVHDCDIENFRLTK